MQVIIVIMATEVIRIILVIRAMNVIEVIKDKEKFIFLIEITFLRNALNFLSL